MGQFNWRSLLDAAEGTGQGTRRPGRGLSERERSARLERLRSEMECQLAVLGLALACLAMRFDDSWVTASPVFSVLGASASCLLLAAFWLVGGLLWLFTRNTSLCARAADLLPFGLQPGRSALGVLAFFLILAALWRHLPVVRSLGFEDLLWHHQVLGGVSVLACVLAGAVWLAKVV